MKRRSNLLFSHWIKICEVCSVLVGDIVNIVEWKGHIVRRTGIAGGTKTILHRYGGPEKLAFFYTRY